MVTGIAKITKRRICNSPFLESNAVNTPSYSHMHFMIPTISMAIYTLHYNYSMHASHAIALMHIAIHN